MLKNKPMTATTAHVSIECFKLDVIGLFPTLNITIIQIEEYSTFIYRRKVP